MPRQFRPRRQRSSATVGNLHITYCRNAIDRQKPGVVRRICVFRTRIPKTDNQLHARTTPFSNLLLALVASNWSSSSSVHLALLRHFRLSRTSNRLNCSLFPQDRYMRNQRVFVTLVLDLV